ncbi:MULTISPECIES: 2-dehydropantoate 2-reductase [Rhodomicrobium]|uniref:ketopantoate reductase family protein n=1 Tax=Rhodomicrobium TaxID=1068 RepID=UPI000B4C165A|nr:MULTISPECIES: 2-dehydropantoate 2-reductase [Rhodomicrobium]
MKIAIAGAGSIGSVIAAYLARAGHDVSLRVRGPHLQAIREHGLTAISRGERLHSRPTASDDAAALGQHDLVIVTAKAHSLAALAPAVALLRGPGAPVIAAQNGIPRWYFHGQPLEGAGAALSNRPFERVDPDGTAWRIIRPEHTIGCVINIPAEVTEPGTVEHSGVLRLTLGAPDVKAPPSGMSEAAEALTAAGIETSITDQIRRAIWIKLQVNMSVGPCAVLTGATSGQARASEGMIPLLGAMMREAHAVAAALGVDIPHEASDWLARGGGNDGHKPSILQDFEAGRPLEADAMVGAVVDLAGLTGVVVPLTEAMLTLLRLKITRRDAAA